MKRARTVAETAWIISLCRLAHHTHRTKEVVLRWSSLSRAEKDREIADVRADRAQHCVDQCWQTLRAEMTARMAAK